MTWDSFPHQLRSRRGGETGELPKALGKRRSTRPKRRLGHLALQPVFWVNAWETTPRFPAPAAVLHSRPRGFLPAPENRAATRRPPV